MITLPALTEFFIYLQVKYTPLAVGGGSLQVILLEVTSGNQEIVTATGTDPEDALTNLTPSLPTA